MGSDVLRRVRWRNVARVAAAVVVVAAVVAWPRLGPPRPDVPSDVALPLVTTTPEAVPTPGESQVEPRVVPRAAPRVRRPHVRRRAAKVPRRDDSPRMTTRREEPPVVTPAATTAPAAPAESPVPPAPATDAAQAEFGFER